MAGAGLRRGSRAWPVGPVALAAARSPRHLASKKGGLRARAAAGAIQTTPHDDVEVFERQSTMTIILKTHGIIHRLKWWHKNIINKEYLCFYGTKKII